MAPSEQESDQSLEQQKESAPKSQQQNTELDKGADQQQKSPRDMDDVPPPHVPINTDTTTRAINQQQNSNSRVNQESIMTPNQLKEQFIKAINNNDIKLVEELTKNKEFNINGQYAQNATPLHLAANKGNNKVVELLIKNGAALDSQDSSGRTPLDIALVAGKQDAAQLLVNEGATRNITKPRQNTKHEPSAVRAEQPKTKPRTINQQQKPNHVRNTQHQSQIKPDSEKEQLRKAIIANDTKLVANLLEKKRANVNEKYEYNATPLHIAAHIGNKKMVKLLIDKGAQVDTQDIGGRTPLHIASFGEKTEAAQVLVKKGANQNIPNPLSAQIQEKQIEKYKQDLDKIIGAESTKNKFDKIAQLQVQLEKKLWPNEERINKLNNDLVKKIEQNKDKFDLGELSQKHTPLARDDAALDKKITNYLDQEKLALNTAEPQKTNDLKESLQVLKDGATKIVENVKNIKDIGQKFIKKSTIKEAQKWGKFALNPQVNQQVNNTTRVMGQPKRTSRSM